MDGVRYDELRPGDLFRFDYPHHGDAPFRRIWRRLDQGYERVDGSERRPDISPGVPIRLERVSSLDDAPSPCPVCEAPWDLYVHRRGTELAVNEERHALLVQCDGCGALFEVFPEERAVPKELDVDQARARFPGAL